MSTNTTPLVSGIIIPVATVATTIILFCLFKFEGNPGALFYFNMCYTCALEALFFGYLGFLRRGKGKTTGAMYSIMGVYSLYYIIVAVVVMLSYAVLLSTFIPLKFYIAAVVIISLLWLIMGSLLVETDTNFKENTEKLQAQGRTLGYFLKRIEILEKRYITISSELSIPYESKSYLCELSRLSTKIKSLMPNFFTNDMAQTKLQDIIDNCTSLINEVEQCSDTDKTKVAARVKHFVDNSIDEIELIKSLTRR